MILRPYQRLKPIVQNPHSTKPLNRGFLFSYQELKTAIFGA